MQFLRNLSPLTRAFSKAKLLIENIFTSSTMLTLSFFVITIHTTVDSQYSNPRDRELEPPGNSK